MLAEERIQTIGIRDVHGQRVRFTMTPSGVEVAGENGESVTFRKDDWQQVVEGSVRQYGRQLHTSLPVTGVIHCTDQDRYLGGRLEDGTSLIARDVCENCGAGFGMDGSAIHFPSSIGVCSIAQGPARGGPGGPGV